MTDDPGFGIKHEKHCPTKHQRGHPWHPGYKCPGCAAIRAAVAEKVGCSHEAELTKLRSLVMERDRRHTLLEEADTEIAERRQQVEALQQLLDEIIVASGAGIVCRPIDLPAFISSMKAELAALRAALAAFTPHGMRDVRALWANGEVCRECSHALCERFREAQESALGNLAKYLCFAKELADTQATLAVANEMSKSAQAGLALIYRFRNDADSIVNNMQDVDPVIHNLRVDLARFHEAQGKVGK